MDDFATGYLAGQDGGNNSGFFGNEGLWAVIILAIIFGWGTNGYGRNGGDNGMNAYIPYLVGTGATGQGGADTRAALSEGFYQQDTSRSLAGIQSGICSLGYDQLAQMNTLNAAIAGGFAGTNQAICQLGYQNAQLVNGLERSVSNGDNATFCKDSAFHRPLAVLRNSICGTNVPKSLCHVRSTEKNLSIFFNRAKLAKGLVLENVKCVTSLVIHHILHIQLFGVFHADLIRLVSDSR